MVFGGVERYIFTDNPASFGISQKCLEKLGFLQYDESAHPTDPKFGKAYLTTISLPCAYIKAEFEEDHDLDNIKVDLYLPTFGEYKQVGNGKYKLKNNEDSDDSVRQSFMLFRKEVPELYEAFSKNINDILLHAEEISFHTEEENDDEI